MVAWAINSVKIGKATNTCNIGCHPTLEANGALIPAEIALNTVIDNEYMLVINPILSGKKVDTTAGANTFKTAIPAPVNKVPNNRKLNE